MSKGAEMHSRIGEFFLFFVVALIVSTTAFTQNAGITSKQINSIFSAVESEDQDSRLYIWKEDFESEEFDASRYFFDARAKVVNYNGRKCLLLVEKTSSNSRGRFFFKPTIYSDTWTAEFDLLIGGGTTLGGADGLTFALVKDYNYPPITGGCMDFCNAEGYAVEFDVYHNGEYNDPGGEEHIAVLKDGVDNHLAYYVASDGEIEDNQWHNVKVVFDNGTISVYFDGSLKVSCQITDYTPDYYYFGFTAATGSGTNDHLIDNVNVYTSVSDTRSSITGNIVDKNNNLVKIEGATISLSNRFFTESSFDGSYSLLDIPIGTYTITVTKEGYETYKDQINLESASQLNYDVELISRPANVKYVGSLTIKGTSDCVIDELDNKISGGDHIHLRLPFKNIGGYTENSVIHIANLPNRMETQPEILFSKEALQVWVSSEDFNISQWQSEETRYIDLFCYIERINPDKLGKKVIPDNPKFVISTDGGDSYTVELVLEKVDFVKYCPQDKLEFIEGECLAHPENSQIIQYAQWACGNSDTINFDLDPDKLSRAVANVLRTIDSEFCTDSNKLFEKRIPDFELLKRRNNKLGVCRHYSDLSVGVLRSLSIPTRRTWGVFKNLHSYVILSHQWNEYWDVSDWYYYDAAMMGNCEQEDKAYPTKCSLVYKGIHPSIVRAETSRIGNISSLHPSFKVDYVIKWLYSKAYCHCNENYDNRTRYYKDDCTQNNVPGNLFQNTGLSWVDIQFNPLNYQYEGDTLILSGNITNIDSIIYRDIVIESVPLDTLNLIYDRLDSVIVIDSLYPDESDTFAFRYLLKESGAWPLIIGVSCDDSTSFFSTWVQVGIMGELPKLVLDASASMSTVERGSAIDMAAQVLDTAFTIIDDCDQVRAYISDSNQSSYIDSLLLNYDNIDSLYEASYSIPSDFSPGIYKITFVSDKSGFRSDTTESYFVVVAEPVLSINLDKSIYLYTDSLCAIAHLSDNQTNVDSARVILEVSSYNSVLGSYQAYNTQDGEYSVSFYVEDLLRSNYSLDSISAQCKLSCFSEYEGGRAIDSTIISIDMPDLSISSLYFTPDGPFDDEFLNITVKVKNTGTAESDSTFIRVFDGALIDSCRIGGDIKIARLAPNEEEYVSFYTYLGGMQGDHNIMVIVDPDRETIDRNRSNNIQSSHLHVFGRVAGDEISDNDKIPKKFNLLQNYPNPFNPITTIKFDLVENAQTYLAIYSVEGKLVRTLISQRLPANHYEIVWDGRDSRGKMVSSGVYFLLLKSGNKKLVRKMVILK